MTILEAAKKLNREMLDKKTINEITDEAKEKNEEIRRLKEKVALLEEVLANLVKRLDYIELRHND